MTCIGNSGPLPEPVAEAIEKVDIIDRKSKSLESLQARLCRIPCYF